MKINYIFNKISNAIFPKDVSCICCGNEICFEEERKFSICEKCYKKMKFIGEKVHRIENASLNFKKHLALFSYEDITRKMILRFKDGDCPFLGGYIANLLYNFYQKNIDSHFDYICFVPSSKKKIRKRGYDPMEIVANEFSKATDIRVAKNLARKNKGFDQTESIERFQNIKNSYFFVENENFDIKDKHILLLDDVVTTGATAGECSKVLLENGAKDVFLFTFAEAKTFKFYKDKTINRMENNREKEKEKYIIQ